MVGASQLIATGYTDLADYISAINKTLKPATKKVLSGTTEFNLTSLMLED